MEKRSNKIKYLAPFIVLLSFLFIFVEKTFAASLSLSPNSITSSIGNIFPIKVLVNTDGKYINNSEATIEFPVDMLDVVSITKGSSIFNLWVEEPSYSNIGGKIVFNGGVPSPGFNGQGGYIATVTFKAKKQGTASILFTDAFVRENDGLGTDILSSKNSSSVVIGTPKIIEVPITINEKSVLPEKPIIISDTHPKEDIWYSNNSANFSWKVPNGVTSVQTLINKISNSTPTVVYDSSVTQKTINNLTDGTYYFHLRHLNSKGYSPVDHYKINIDTTPPLSFVPVIRSEFNKNIIKLNAIDETSGIDYYTIQVDGGVSLKVYKKELIEGEYTLPIESEGTHSILVVAYDKALNHTESSLAFVSGSISSPLVYLSTRTITTGDEVVINGKTDYPNTKVEVLLELDGKEIGNYKEVTSPDGTFSLSSGKIKEIGLISISAKTIFSDLVESPISQKVYLEVNQIEAIKVTLSIFYPLIGILLIMIILIIIFFLLYLGWHRFFSLKKKIHNDLSISVTKIHRAMLLIKNELSSQLKTLESIKVDRNLNDQEKIIFMEISKNIDKFIEDNLKKLM